MVKAKTWLVDKDGFSDVFTRLQCLRQGIDYDKVMEVMKEQDGPPKKKSKKKEYVPVELC